MDYINSEMTIHTILTRYPFLVSLFAGHGLKKFEDVQVLEKLGPFVKLKTALKAARIDSEQFVAMLNNCVLNREERDDFTLSEDPQRQKELTLLALLPCGMKMPFSRALEEYIEGYNRAGDTSIRYLMEGNVNHEISYYAYIDTVDDIDELPDIIISSDVNSFYHRKFMDNFVKPGVFIDTSADHIHNDFFSAGYSDPNNNFTMLSANLLVLVAVPELLGERPVPGSWRDLLDSQYEDSIAMRGDNNFFCNGVLLPFYQMFGTEGVENMSRSVTVGLHPSEMVKMIDSKRNDVPPLYVMPFFFAQKIRDRDRIKIVIPHEGAILSPVQMLVKKESVKPLAELVEFLQGKQLGQICADAYFPSMNSTVDNRLEGVDRLYWLGWDFLYNEDIGSIKREIDITFRKKFSPGQAGA